MAEQEDDIMLGITEAAKRIGVSPSNLRRAVRLKQLPSQTIAGSYIVKLSDAQKWKANPTYHRPGVRKSVTKKNS